MPEGNMLEWIAERVQRRLSGYGTPPDKERIKAILSALTVDEALAVAEWQSDV